MITYQLTSTVEQLHSFNVYYDPEFKNTVIVFQNYERNTLPSVIELNIRDLQLLKKKLQWMQNDVTNVITMVGNKPNQCFLLSYDLTFGTTFNVFDETRVEKVYSFTDNQIELIIGFITDIIGNGKTNFIVKI